MLMPFKVAINVRPALGDGLAWSWAALAMLRAHRPEVSSVRAGLMLAGGGVCGAWPGVPRGRSCRRAGRASSQKVALCPKKERRRPGGQRRVEQGGFTSGRRRTRRPWSGKNPTSVLRFRSSECLIFGHATL